MYTLRTCALVVLSLNASAPTNAGWLFTPADFKARVTHPRAQAIIFYYDNRQDMVLKLDYRIDSPTPPTRVLWIIPVPNVPDHYEQAEAALFPDTEMWCRRNAGLPRQANSTAPADLDFDQTVKIAPYDVTLIQALGREAVDQLNSWLSERGYATQDPEALKFFINSKFTFMCVQIRPPAGANALPRSGGLPPLRFSFETPKLYVPLKTASGGGPLDMQLILLTHRPFDYSASAACLKRLNWVDEKRYRPNAAVTVAAFPNTLSAVLKSSAMRDLKGGWMVNVIEARGIDADGSLATWSDDILMDTRSP